MTRRKWRRLGWSSSCIFCRDGCGGGRKGGRGGEPLGKDQWLLYEYLGRLVKTMLGCCEEMLHKKILKPHDLEIQQ